MCISHHGCEKYSNLWCQISAKWNSKSKNLKQILPLPQGKNLSTVLIITPKVETAYLFPPVQWEDYENLFLFMSYFSFKLELRDFFVMCFYLIFENLFNYLLSFNQFIDIFDALLIITLFLLVSLVCFTYFRIKHQY